MSNNQNPSKQSAGPKTAGAKVKKLLLGDIFKEAPVRVEPEEPQKVVVAGLAEAKPQKEYPDTFFGRANAVFRGELSTLFKESLCFVIFTLPFILVMTLGAKYFQEYILGGAYNFMGDIGIGYPGGADSIAESVAKLYWNVKQPVLMMLAGAGLIAAIGLPGIFYAAKRSYFQDYYKRIAPTYFMGVAKYWWHFILLTLIGVLICLAMGTAMLYLLAGQSVGAASAGAYCAVVFSFLFGIPLLTVPMVMMPLIVSYQLNFGEAFKNAIVIIVNCPVSVAITGVLTAIPFLLLIAGNTIAVIIYILMALAGFAYCALALTALVNRSMIKCTALKINSIKKAQVKKQPLKSKDEAVKEAVQPQQVKKKPQPKPQFQNPKKKKKK